MNRRKLLGALLAVPAAMFATSQPKKKYKLLTKTDLRKAKDVMAKSGIRPLFAGYYELRTIDPQTVLDWPIWDDLKVSRTSLTEGCHLMPGIHCAGEVPMKFSLVGQTETDQRVGMFF